MIALHFGGVMDKEFRNLLQEKSDHSCIISLWQKTIDVSSVPWIVLLLVAWTSSEWNMILLLLFLHIIWGRNHQTHVHRRMCLFSTIYSYGYNNNNIWVIKMYSCGYFVCYLCIIILMHCTFWIREGHQLSA